MVLDLLNFLDGMAPKMFQLPEMPSLVPWAAEHVYLNVHLATPSVYCFLLLAALNMVNASLFSRVKFIFANYGISFWGGKLELHKLWVMNCLNFQLDSIELSCFCFFVFFFLLEELRLHCTLFPLNLIQNFFFYTESLKLDLEHKNIYKAFEFLFCLLLSHIWDFLYFIFLCRHFTKC